MVGRDARFDSDQAPRHIGEPGCDPAAGDLLPQNDRPVVVEADQMQGILARIDADGGCDCSGCLMGHGDMLLVLLSPRTFSERFGAGARPGPPLLRHQPWWRLSAVGGRFKITNPAVTSAPEYHLSPRHLYNP